MKTKFLVIGASNSNRPPIKCWPHYIAEHFDIHVRNAAWRGITPEHVYEIYAANMDYNPDLILVDIPPWYRYHIALSDVIQDIAIKKINHITSNYQEVEYKPFKGIVPIGGFITKNNQYSEWLKLQTIPGHKINLYDIYKRRVKNKENFDVVINTLNDVRHSPYFKNRALKDILLLKNSANVPIKFLHTIGPFESIDLPEEDFLCENAYNWLKRHNKSYENFFEDEWAHFKSSTHELVAKELYIPAICNLLDSDIL